MGDMTQDLEGHHQVQRSRIINHPAYSSPVLMTQYGWAKRGHQTNWYKTKMNDEISMQEAMLSSRKKYKADLLPVLKTEERVNKALRIEREFLYKMRHEVSRRRGWPQE